MNALHALSASLALVTGLSACESDHTLTLRFEAVESLPELAVDYAYPGDRTWLDALPDTHNCDAVSTDHRQERAYVDTYGLIVCPFRDLLAEEIDWFTVALQGDIEEFGGAHLIPDWHWPLHAEFLLDQLHLSSIDRLVLDGVVMYPQLQASVFEWLRREGRDPYSVLLCWRATDPVTHDREGNIIWTLQPCGAPVEPKGE